MDRWFYRRRGMLFRDRFSQRKREVKTRVASYSRVCRNPRRKKFSSLEALRNFFGCGSIFRNRRYDNHHEDLYRYCVRSLGELREKIIPFFQKHPLRTSKRDDFEKFIQDTALMAKGEHLNLKGIEKIAKIAQTMNRKRPSKFLESSE